jgi:hypothetical protein
MSTIPLQELQAKGEFKEVKLKDLQPIPERDMQVDPVDRAQVERLKESILDTGFWGGIRCCRIGDKIYVAAGWHRVTAAVELGIEKAVLFVGNLDAHERIRAYGTENASQRGNGGTAPTGTVAAAIHLLTKQLLTSPNLSFLSERSPQALNMLINQVVSGDIGEPIVTEFLGKIPGISSASVQQQIANLKASDHYARIMRDVADEIEREHAVDLEGIRTREEEVARKKKEQQEAQQRERQAVATREELKKLHEQEELERRKQIQEARERKLKADREAAMAREADKKRKQAEADKRKAELEAQGQQDELARQKAKEAKLEADRRAREAKQDQEKARQDLLDARERLNGTEAKKVSNAAKQAVEAAEAREVTFDLEGVSKYLKVESHVVEFRRLTAPKDPDNPEGTVVILPPKSEDGGPSPQEQFAAKLVDDYGPNLTVERIRAAFGFRFDSLRQRIEADRKAAANKSKSESIVLKELFDEFIIHTNRMMGTASRIEEKMKNYPPEKYIPWPGGFFANLEPVIMVLTKLYNKGKQLSKATAKEE